MRTTVRVERSAYEIHVSDTGIGVAPRDQARIFETFTRVSASKHKQRDGGGGVGLGLSLVQRLAAALGGVVTVTSELGVGSTFIVRLPLDARPHATARAPFLGGLG